MDDGEPVDAVGPWTIKAVATRTREVVTNAARREGLTVGQWLERRVTEWEGQGSPTPVSHPAAPAPGAPFSGLGELAEALQAAHALAGAAGVAVPAQLARDAIATVRHAMRSARGLPSPPARKKPLAIEG